MNQTRICPQCKNIISYKSLGGYLASNKNNSKCRKCASKNTGFTQRFATLGQNIGKNNIRTKYFIDTNSYIRDFNINTTYILGFLWADGTLGFNHNISLEIISDDMNDIWQTFCYTGNWGKYTRLRKHWKSQTSAKVTDHILYKFLIDNGYAEKKEPKILSLIPKELHYMWYRGYIDGDGCWYLNMNTYLRQFIISSEYNNDWSYIEKLFDSLNVKYSISRTISKKGHQSSSIRSCGYNNICKIGNYLYQDNIGIGLKRKYSKFLDIQNSSLIS